jgi:SNF family Na+-dependent transporter
MNRTTYIVAMMGYCMGLGNLWRFPYLCYRWGGMLFFIPYLFSLFVVGIPISLLEITLGQKFQLGDVGVFRAIHPRLTGIGYASIMASYSLVVYYNVMIAWSLIFLITSFINPLPWSMKRTQPGTNYKTCPQLFISEE